METTTLLKQAIAQLRPELPALVGDGWPEFEARLDDLVRQLEAEPENAPITRAMIMALFGQHKQAQERLIAGIADVQRSEAVLEGARTIRPYLHELVGAEAGDIDGELAGLLARAAQGQKTDTLIINLLARRESTADWMRAYLDEASANTRSAGTKGYSRPGGDPDPIAAQRYVCPVAGDTVWYRQYAGEDIPMCKSHKVQLVAAP